MHVIRHRTDRNHCGMQTAVRGFEIDGYVVLSVSSTKRCSDRAYILVHCWCKAVDVDRDFVESNHRSL
jgi:hypothetical protein